MCSTHSKFGFGFIDESCLFDSILCKFEKYIRILISIKSYPTVYLFIALVSLGVRVSANDLGYLKPGSQITGKLEYSTPSGFRCSFESSPRANIVFGVGVSKPQVLSGQSIGGITSISGDLLSETIVIPSTVSEAEPVGGVLFQIPLGGRPKKNCDYALELYEYQVKYENAQMMFELGIISEDELRVVGRNYYHLMLQNQPRKPIDLE